MKETSKRFLEWFRDFVVLFFGESFVLGDLFLLNVMKSGSAAKLIVEALLQRFLPLARRRIETAQAQDGQYLRPSDPAYEQVLDSLAMIARHTSVPLLEALLKWRESESPKGANDASTFQRKLPVECIFCSACIQLQKNMYSASLREEQFA